MSHRKAMVSLALAAALIPVTLPEAASAQPVAVNTPYYTPQYYVDHLVYFDVYGRPIYYDGGVAYLVPSTYAYYNDLVNHYRLYANQYLRWYQTVGYSQTAYRRPVHTGYYTPQYYNDYVVYYDRFGRPVYYVDGRMYHVPRSYAYYRALLGHYRRYSRHYLRWYNAYGSHYRYYRRPVYTSYYTPLYYDGYVVYYDNLGRPIYYVNGALRYVPSTFVGYNRYVSHYRTHRSHYSRWYRAHGQRYRAYRRPAGYHGRRKVTTAPRGRTYYRQNPFRGTRPGHTTRRPTPGYGRRPTHTTRRPAPSPGYRRHPTPSPGYGRRPTHTTRRPTPSSGYGRRPAHTSGRQRRRTDSRKRREERRDVRRDRRRGRR